MRGFAGWLGFAVLWACAGAEVPPAAAPLRTLREAGLRAKDDVTIRGAWLFPEALDEAHGWGVEPGGGMRAIVAGVRLVSNADGSIVVAPDRLPATPSTIVAVPDRLGGGFLFAVGAHLWRASGWLGHATPLYTSSLPIAQVLVGLDRVYLRSPQGALVALDPRTGAPAGAGPLPASPNIGRLAAVDAWRAVAIADLRGALMTLDAGWTWRPLALPIEASEVVTVNDAFALGGVDEGRQVQWWEVRGEGQATKLSFPPSTFSLDRLGTALESDTSARGVPKNGDRPRTDALRIFGPHPLVAAVEDGWPLTDGTALVARDGALARVRLTDGAIVESIGEAFPFKPARCHAISLSTSRMPGAFGFACGELRGRTAIYRFDAAAARLVELRAFENPRQVLGFGNGSLAVRGSCAADAADDAGSHEQVWCVMAPGAPWRDALFPRDDRLVILGDGRVALLRPPLDGDLSSLRLMVEDGGQKSEQKVTLPVLQADVARALRFGVWLDGFEERRAGVIGGWVDAAGAVIGIEIAASGEARVGEYIRDAGAPVTSGRWAFGWTASRRGFETTDGGMTWTKEIALPDPIASGRAVRERACGPIGCLAAGWVRVGWGAAEQEIVPEPRPYVGPRTHAPPSLDLECESLSGQAPVSGAAPATRDATSFAAIRGRAAGAAAGSSGATVSAFPPFAGHGGPPVQPDALGLSVEVSHALERTLRAAPLARIYAWGPKTGEWDQLGRWQVRWQWPWGGGQDVRSSAASAVPWASVDVARRALSVAPGVPTVWMIADGNDADHALLLARHSTTPPTAAIVLLETDRPPVEVRRPNGDPIPDVEAAARLGGVWYVATTQGPGELAATVVWSLEGELAREVVRVPRAGFEARPAVRLARRVDGRAIGLVVDGQRDELRAVTQRWLAPVDLESNSVRAPEPLAPTDLSDRDVSLCTGDDEGWLVDLPYPGTVRVRATSGWEATVEGSFARMRLSSERACVERLQGTSSERPVFSAAAPHARESISESRSIEASVLSGGLRYSLRCIRRR